MLTILLIRHATCDHVGRVIAGRAAGVHLNAAGRDQALALARWLSRTHAGTGGAGTRIQAIYSGPLERATETAEILSGHLEVPSFVEPALDELEFGAWTGLTLTELDRDPVWHAFNSARATTRIPGGEIMGEAVDRAREALSRMEQAHPGGVIAAVSHADIIRGLLLRALGMSLNEIHRLEVAPGSVSTVELWDGELGRVLAVNCRPDGPTA